jgi:hypothetical protein
MAADIAQGSVSKFLNASSISEMRAKFGNRETANAFSNTSTSPSVSGNSFTQKLFDENHHITSVTRSLCVQAKCQRDGKWGECSQSALIEKRERTLHKVKV